MIFCCSCDFWGQFNFVIINRKTILAFKFFFFNLPSGQSALVCFFYFHTNLNVKLRKVVLKAKLCVCMQSQGFFLFRVGFFFFAI